MRFLSPSFLWFLPLALLPLLLNLIFPLKPVRVPFPSVFLLRTARDSRVRKAAVAKVLILALRCLALACLVAGFSRPVAERNLAGPLSGLAAGSGRPLSLVILIDRSLSMNAAFAGRSRRDFAAGAGAGVLAALGPRDEAAPVFFDTEAESGEWTSDFPALSGRIARVPRGFKGTDYRKALEKAYALLAERPSSRLKAVLMLSDGARNGLASMPRDIRRLASYDPEVTLACLDIPPVTNSWLRAAGVHEEGAGAFLSVSAEKARDAAPGTAVKLYAPEFAASAGLRPSPSGGGRAVFRLPDSDDPRGRAVLSPRDRLEEDDGIFFSVTRRKVRAGRILVLHGGPEALKPGRGAYFLRRFFETESGAPGGFSADFMELAAFDRAPDPEYGAIIVFDGPVSAGQAGLLDGFARSGGGVMVVAGFSGSRGVMDSLGFGAGSGLEREFRIAEPGAGVSRPELDGFELDRVSVRRAAVFAAAPANFAPAWYFKDPSGTSYPAMYQGRRGQGAVLAWTSSFDLLDTELPAKPFFAPFISACVRVLYGLRPPALEGTYAGGRYEGRIAHMEPVKVAVSAPDGSVTYVLSKNGSFSYGLTDVPGIYRWKAGAETGAFSVNPDPENGESSLEKENSPPWVQLSAEFPVEDFRSAVYGVEIGQFLLLLALSAFLGEFLLSRRAL